MMDALQDIAKGFNIPVVISNQAHRQVGNKGDAPTKDNSFQSDAPAQEADHVIGLKHFEEERKLVLRCSKNRFGQNFRVECRFVPNVGILEDMTPIRGDYFNGTEEPTAEEVEAMVNEIDGEE
jgi:hypothetical protein